MFVKLATKMFTMPTVTIKKMQLSIHVIVNWNVIKPIAILKESLDETGEKVSL